MYEVDLQQITLLEFQALLSRQNLMAARRVLKNGIDTKFAALSAAGLNDVSELAANLQTEAQTEALAERSGVAADYLGLLKREIANLTPRQVLLSDFPYLSQDAVIVLAENRIKNPKDFYLASAGCRDGQRVCRSLGIPDAVAAELCGLCDLIRVNGLGPVFARILYEAGFTGVASLAGTAPEEVYRRTRELNEIHCYTRVLPRLEEISYCVDFAKLLLRNEGEERSLA